MCLDRPAVHGWSLKRTAGVGLDPYAVRHPLAAPDQSDTDLPANREPARRRNFYSVTRRSKAQSGYLGIEVDDAMEIAEKIDV